MFKKVLKIFKLLFIVLISIFLVSIGIDAADHYGNFSESILGGLLNKKQDLCPVEMAYVSTARGGFCIDKYEASVGSSCPHANPENQTQTKENIDDIDCRPASKAGVFSWRFVSQSQAAIICSKAGKRLPSAQEWHEASLGTPDKKKDWDQDDCQVNNNWTEQPGLTGSGKLCISGFSAYDMIGNVWEWVNEQSINGRLGDNDLPQDGYVRSVDLSGLPLETSQTVADSNFNDDYFWVKKGVRGLARGGYWGNKSDAGLFAVYLVAEPTFAGTGVGFRCVK